MDFFQTIRGIQFVDGTMPRIAKALERLAVVGEKYIKDDVLAVSSELAESEHDKIQRALLQIDDIVKNPGNTDQVKLASVAAQRLLKQATGEEP